MTTYLGLTKQQWQKRLEKAENELFLFHDGHAPYCECREGFSCDCGHDYWEQEKKDCQHAIKEIDK